MSHNTIESHVVEWFSPTTTSISVPEDNSILFGKCADLPNLQSFELSSLQHRYIHYSYHTISNSPQNNKTMCIAYRFEETDILQVQNFKTLYILASACIMDHANPSHVPKRALRHTATERLKKCPLIMFLVCPVETKNHYIRQQLQNVLRKNGCKGKRTTYFMTSLDEAATFTKTTIAKKTVVATA